jgi:hypothetical protein
MRGGRNSETVGEKFEDVGENVGVVAEDVAACFVKEVLFRSM